MNDASESGRIWLEDGVIHYESRDYGSWMLPVKDLKAVGEYTTESGPFIDDWFLVFVDSPSAGWYEASIYAEGREAFRSELATLLGVDSFDVALAASSNFASRIIWPKSAHG